MDLGKFVWNYYFIWRRDCTMTWLICRKKTKHCNRKLPRGDGGFLTISCSNLQRISFLTYIELFFCNLTHKEIKRPRSPKKSVSVKYSHWLKPRNSLPKIEKSENFSSWLSLKPRKMGKKPLFENFEAGSFSWVAKVRARLLVWTLNWIGYDFRRPGIINFIPDHSADSVQNRMKRRLDLEC